MTTQHTPGPWEVCDYELGLKAISTPNIKHYIATEIDAADARLIAAAPFLLETLEYIGRSTVDDTAAHLARNAIATATGAA
jgi:hypothetical protein